MVEKEKGCLLCQGSEVDADLNRIQVWEDALWRLTMSLEAEVPGFTYLEPKRHIAGITGLDGAESRTFGEILAWVSRVLRDETAAEIVYVYIFGDDVPHLHVHLAPHQAGDALNSQMIRGQLVSERLESGLQRIVSEEFPPLPEEELRLVALRVQARMEKSS